METNKYSKNRHKGKTMVIDDSYIKKIVKNIDLLYWMGMLISLFSGCVYMADISQCESYFIVKLAYLIYCVTPHFFAIIALLRIVIEVRKKKSYSPLVFLLVLLFAIVYQKYSIDSLIDVYTVVAMAIASLGVDYKKLITLFLFEEAIATVLIIIFSQVGILPNYISEGARTYAYLGFGHHSALSLIVIYNVFALFFLLRENRKFIPITIILLVISVIVFKITNGRTAFLVMMLFILGLLFISVINKYCTESVSKIIFSKLSFALVFSPIFGLLISVVGVLIWNYFACKLEFSDFEAIKCFGNWGTMANRFRGVSVNFATNGLKLPWEPTVLTEYYKTDGYKFSWLFGGKQYSYAIDNVYLQAFVMSGVVVFIGIIASMIYLAYRAYKTEDIVMSWVFACLTVLYIMEGLKYFAYNPFLVIILSDWERKRSLENKGTLGGKSLERDTL